MYPLRLPPVSSSILWNDVDSVPHRRRYAQNSCGSATCCYLPTREEEDVYMYIQPKLLLRQPRHLGPVQLNLQLPLRQVCTNRRVGTETWPNHNRFRRGCSSVNNRKMEAA